MTPSFNRFDPFEAMNDIDNSLSDIEQFYLGVGNDNSSDDIKFFFNKDRTAYLIVTDYHGKYKDEHPIDGKILGIAAKKEARGTGDTDQLISRAKKYFSNDALVAEIDKDNIASQRLVRRNGFKKVLSDEYIDYYVWQRDNNSNIQMENYKMIKSYSRILNEGFNSYFRKLEESSKEASLGNSKTFGQAKRQYLKDSQEFEPFEEWTPEAKYFDKLFIDVEDKEGWETAAEGQGHFGYQIYRNGDGDSAAIDIEEYNNDLYNLIEASRSEEDLKQRYQKYVSQKLADPKYSIEDEEDDWDDDSFF